MLREFKDSKGVDWLVWDVSEKRRVTPVPRGGEEMSDERLELLCHGAGYVSRGARASGDIPVVDRR
jgi:hypothetical protein